MRLGDPWSGGLSWPLLVFLGFLALFHVMFVVLSPLSARQWKQIDYWWLAFAALGILTSAGEVRRLRSSGELELAQWREVQAAAELRSQVAYAVQLHCMNFTRSEWSPPNFDALQAQRARACSWYQHLQAVLADSGDVPGWQRLKGEHFEEAADASDGVLQSDIGRTMALVADGERLSQRSLRLVTAAKRTNFEVALDFLAPYLLSVALALRITKVTGELHLKR